MDAGDWEDKIKFGRFSSFPIKTLIVGPKKHNNPSEESLVIFDGESTPTEESELNFEEEPPTEAPKLAAPAPEPEAQETEMSSDPQALFNKLTRKLSNGTLVLPCSIRY